jgi:hypothetical protein
VPQQHAYQQQHQYQQHPTRRTSYASSTHAQSVQSVPYTSQPVGSHRQPTPQPNYAPPLHPQPQFSQQNPYQHPGYLRSAPLGLPPASVRARSATNVPYAAPSETAIQEDDFSLEALTRAGLTPAQAYQQQVYLNSPMGQQQNQGNRSSYYSPHSSESHVAYEAKDGSARHVPRVNLNLDSNGDLGLNFGIETSSPATDDPTSELPWAMPPDDSPCTSVCSLYFRSTMLYFFQQQSEHCTLRRAALTKVPLILHVHTPCS